MFLPPPEEENMEASLSSQAAEDWRKGRCLRAYELAQRAGTRRPSPRPSASPRALSAVDGPRRWRDAPAFGFTGDVWTARRVAAVLQTER